MLADDPFQCPAQSAAGKFRSRFGSLGGVLSPYVPALGAAVAADTHQQSSRSPAEGFMAEPACYGVSRDAVASASVAPLVRFGDTAGQNGSVRADMLPGHLEPESVEASECGQVRAVEGSVDHEGLAVENQWSRYLDSPVRPSPHLNDYRPWTAHGPHQTAGYTLNSEEPVINLWS